MSLYIHKLVLSPGGKRTKRTCGRVEIYYWRRSSRRRRVDMSLSPKHTTSTSFSVSDILSPFEDSYKKTSIEAAIPPLVPPGGYLGLNSGSSGSTPAPAQTMSSMSGMNGSMANPYNYMSHLSQHTSSFASQYCNGSDLTPYADPMQVRNTTAGWYATNPDPRFASKYRTTQGEIVA